MPTISRVLVANRGEIAVRIIRACKALGIGTVVTVSEADKDSLAARLADRAVCIGGPRPGESYLNIEAIVAAARGTGADAVHPGYGFLAERRRLADACHENGLIFVGPPGEVIEKMGNKIEARIIAERCGVPIVPGSDKVRSVADASEVAARIGYPLLLKAAAGGGGRGMRIVIEESGLRSAFESAAAEAGAAFGDDTIYIERYIRHARHIEVQIIGDKHGNLVHLGERDCSSQRRYQKIIEEAPAPFLDSLRSRIHEAALKLAREVRYENAGTIEFIVDRDADEFYFLEMNTRIQVEHPVTEMITGIDIVQEQLRVAAGAPLSFRQEDIRFWGHSIECRVNAESARDGFRPSPGRITVWRSPEGPQIRIDTHCAAGYLVPPYYDSMLAKVIVHAPDRMAAIILLERALSEMVVEGVSTTIPFVAKVIAKPDFRDGQTHVRWIEELLAQFPDTVN